MPTLSEFLLARLDEEEALAKSLVEQDQWHGIRVDGATEVAVHIERWSPIYVLADIEAKRTIIRECRYEQGRTPVSPRARWLAGYTLQTMVRVYADHKDYRSEWEWVPL